MRPPGAARQISSFGATRGLSPLLGLVAEAAATLAASGSARPRWTAEQIAASVLDCEPVALVVDPPRCSAAQAEEVRRRVAWRAAGVPLQRVTGIAGFYGRDFCVAAGVFIPRPETERLVEVAVRECSRLPVARPTVVDVGTGSGAVAISLTLAVSAATMGRVVGLVGGFDVCAQALAVAKANAERLGAPGGVRWVRADLLAPCAGAQVDLVVANLPYLPSSSLPSLPREVQWDPPGALDGGPDGLRVIRRLLGQAATRLHRWGVVVLEVGEGQASRLIREFAAAWAQWQVVPDDVGIERVVVFRRPLGASRKEAGSLLKDEQT